MWRQLPRSHIDICIRSRVSCDIAAHNHGLERIARKWQGTKQFHACQGFWPLLEREIGAWREAYHGGKVVTTSS